MEFVRGERTIPIGRGFLLFRTLLDQALGLSEDEHQCDVQEEVIRLAADLPYQRSTEHFGRLTGVWVSAHLGHDKLNEVGEHATLQELIPTTEQMKRRIAVVAGATADLATSPARGCSATSKAAGAHRGGSRCKNLPGRR